MKFNVIRSVAATLSIGLSTIASAQYGQTQYGQPHYAYPYGASAPAPATVPQQQPAYNNPQAYNSPQAYQAPAKWNSFGRTATAGPTLFQPASSGDLLGQQPLPSPESIPTPTPSYGSAQPMGAPMHTPQPMMSQPVPQGQHSAAPMQHSAPVTQYSSPQVHVGAPVDDSNCQSCNQPSAFVQAASQPWEGMSYAAPSCGIPVAAPTRAPLFPWFGSFDLLFFNLDTNGKDRNLISAYSAADPTRPYLPSLGLRDLDPDSGLGYQVGFGRYFGCGQYGVGVNYFNFDPDSEVANSGVFAPLTAAGGGGNFRASGMPHYTAATMDYFFDNGTQAGDSGDDYQEITGAGSPYTVYEIVDGRAGQAAADGGDLDADANGNVAGTDSLAEAVMVQARRDVDIQGVELNLFSFGLMGAQRASALSCGGGGGFNLGSIFGRGYGGVGGYGGGACQPCGDPCAQACGPQACGPRHGFGGAAGPLVRPCHGKVQVITSHGLRWFQFRDSLNFAYDIDGRAGFGDRDLYDDTTTENNLIGYQFGSSLVYCLTNRVNFRIGGKFGVYGNNAEFRHRLGTRLTAAELAAMPGEQINYSTDETVLSTLGELDLGLGFRLTNAWTLRAGYRVMGVTGIATADNYSRDYSSPASAGALHADSSLVLHGAYLGADFNY